jgi:hypothetical protein
MPAPRAPQDHKPARAAAKKTAQRSPTAARARAASEAALARKASATEPKGADNDALRAEAIPEVVERPKGCPDLVPVLHLRRRRRADYMRAIDRMNVTIRKVTKETGLTADDDPEEAQRRIESSPSLLAVTADMAELAADIEECLGLVAVDPDEFEAWAAARSTTDDQMIQAWHWYQSISGDAGNPSASPD